MGVTIHFEGRLKDPSGLQRVMEAAQRLADRTGWKMERIEEELTTLQRVRDDEDWDYTGPTSGAELRPHEDCEPLRLEFDRDFYVQEFTKTQFAPPEIHITIIAFLKSIASEFDSLQVDDEGEYWETGSRKRLIQHLDACAQALKDILSTTVGARGPVVLPNGRIVDYLE